MGSVGVLLARARGNAALWAALPLNARRALIAIAATTTGQVALGITALMHYVPVELGVAHQAGALTVWTVSLVLLHSLRRPAAAAASVKLAARAANMH